MMLTTNENKLEPAYRYRCDIERVVDGDTLIVAIDLGLRVWVRGVPVRLIGIDAPDKEPRKSDATAWLRAWIASCPASRCHQATIIGKR